MTPAPPTLVIDIGGTGLKASVLDGHGDMVTDRVRIPTTYPCAPDVLVTRLGELVRPLPPFDRVSVGFPGVVRDGIIRSAPKFNTVHGPGSPIDKELLAKWDRFDLGAALARTLGRPVRIINDADLQGLHAFTGDGMEVVITLGAGLGFSISERGQLGPHLELGRHVFRNGKNYDDVVGDAARQKIGNARWNRRVQRVITDLAALTFFDHLYIGGGNARRLTGNLGANVTVIDPNAGILGGHKLWDPTSVQPH